MVLPGGHVNCGMMIGCAAATRLPGHSQRVRDTTATFDERPGQRRGNPGAAPPGRCAGAAAGYDPAAVLPWRPAVPGGSAAPLPRDVLGRFRLLVRADTVL